MPNSPNAAASPFSPNLLEEAPYTYDAGASPDNTQLNANRNTPWLIQTHEHVRLDTKEFHMLRFSSSSPLTQISGFSVSSLASAPGDLHLDQDKLDRDKDSDAEGSRSGFNERPTLSGGLPMDMRIEIKPDLNMRTGLNGDSDEAVFTRDALRRPLTPKLINDLGNGDVRPVAGFEHRDMGASESFGPLAFDYCGPASPISGFVSVTEDSGDSAVGSLSSKVLGDGSRSIDRCEGGEGELEQCGLLKSLLESSDPWGLMRTKVLNLPSPTPEEIERKGKKEAQDLVRSFGRRGVGYVTPPSMDMLLGVIGDSGEVEMKEVCEGRPGEGEPEESQDILDFSSSQLRTGWLLNLRNMFQLTQLIHVSFARRSLSNLSTP